MRKSKWLLAVSLMLILSLVAAPLNVLAATGTGKVLAEKISLTSPEFQTLTLEKGKAKKVSVKVEPAKASAKLSWKSSDEKVVTVTKDGTVKGIKNGTAKVVGTATDGSKKKVTVQVTVGKPVTSVSVSNTKLTLTQGQTSTVKTTVKPAAASNKKLNYKSSDSKVVTVSASGKLKAVKAGKAVITVKATDGSGKTAKVTVTVKAKTVNRVLTEKDVVKGKILVSNATYGKLVINKSVGEAEIQLSNVTVTESLEMEPGANYKVISKNSSIKKVISLEEEAGVVKAFAVGETTAAPSSPTFIAEAGTVIINVDARGNVTIKQGADASIGAITVGRKLDGNFEMNLEGFQGKLVVNTQSNASIDITTKDCKIPEATISGIAAGQILSLKDDSADGKASSIGKVNVETNAKLKLNVSTSELVVSEKATSPSIVVNKAVEKIVNSGSNTKLEVNSNVSSIVSSGKALDMTVAAGSTVKNLESTGAQASIEVALGSTVQKVVSKGESAQISGAGKVTEATVEGNNTKIDTSGTSVKVGTGVTGVTSGGQQLPAGTDTSSGSQGGGSGTNPGTNPGGNNGENPGTNPGDNNGGNPGTNPGDNNGGNPGTDPGDNNGGNPGTNPGDNNGGNPGTDPGDNNGGNPGTDPGDNNGGNPGTDPGDNNGGNTDPAVKITINDPGVVWAGNDIQMKADSEDVVWSVFGYIDDTNAYASIDSSTGLLHPYATGTIRVVATSKTNSASYGAVDITVRGKRFVKSILPENVIAITADEELIDVESLRNTDKLPKKVDLVYETGIENKTETITVDLNADSWYGDYNGSMEGIYTLRSYVSVPSGYERPADLDVSIPVEVTVPQSDNRINITGYDELAPIVLEEDNHILNASDLYVKYFYDKSVKVHGSDGNNYDLKISGYYTGESNQYNGAVPGNYTFAVSVPLKGNFKYVLESLSDSSVYLNNQYNIQVSIPIQVKAVQTGVAVSETKKPNTTQPRFTAGDNQAQITELTLTGVPETVEIGQIIDFSQYLTVSADTELSSDKRVIWTLDGYGGSYDSLGSGKFVFKYAGKHVIAVKSAVDKSKTATVNITVNKTESIKSYNSLENINVTEDLHIADFTSAYNALKDRLPKYVIGVTDTEKNVKLPVQGWYLYETDAGSITVYPNASIPYQYNNDTGSVKLKIVFETPQTDIRIKVVSGSAIESTVSVTSDLYATQQYYLVKGLYDKDKDGKDIVNVKLVLADGTEVTESCQAYSYSVTNLDKPGRPYDGSIGNYLVQLYLTLPSKYVYTGNGYFIVEQQVSIETPQFPKNENIWVMQVPKLDYHPGENLYLSDLLVRIKDYTNVETETWITIGYDKFEEYGLKLRLRDSSGSIITSEDTLTADMNGAYIYVARSNYYDSCFFGPLQVTEITE